MHRRFFFNDTATTEIYTLSLHDALPISLPLFLLFHPRHARRLSAASVRGPLTLEHHLEAFRPSHEVDPRSEEHTSELQSRQYLVCRLLLEKKKKIEVIYLPSDRSRPMYT